MIADPIERPESPPRPFYASPRVVRVAVHTTRDQLNWQYAGQMACTGHNHDAGTSGCAFPQ